jgi:hypothetical protein
MVEYHVDSYKEFQERMNEETKFGGKLSMKMNKEEKPFIYLDMIRKFLNKFCYGTKR